MWAIGPVSVGSDPQVCHLPTVWLEQGTVPLRVTVILCLTKGTAECPGGPVVRTPHLHCRGLGSIPGQQTRIPLAMQHGKNNNNKFFKMNKNCKRGDSRSPWAHGGDVGVTHLHKHSDSETGQPSGSPDDHCPPPPSLQGSPEALTRPQPCTSPPPPSCPRRPLPTSRTRPSATRLTSTPRTRSKISSRWPVTRPVSSLDR